MIPLKFAGKIDLIRRAQGLTLAALSAMSRVNDDTLERIIQGRNAPSAANFLRLLRALNAHTDAFDPSDLEVGQ